MTTASVPDSVRTIVADQLGLERSRVRDHDDLRQDLGADSLDYIELAMAIEEEFKALPLPDQEVEGWRTVADVMATAERIAARSAS